MKYLIETDDNITLIEDEVTLEKAQELVGSTVEVVNFTGINTEHIKFLIDGVPVIDPARAEELSN